MSKISNRLANETSPYLKQHSNNPVDWYPWGKEALEKAKNEDKLIFISIGYSACHWCHVMEKESFENHEIAGILNSHFVSIKIDREERPDLDQTYMSAVQLMSGSGGWPLSCFATPEAKPFYGGTYYNPEQFREIIVQLSKLWLSERKRVEEHAEGLCEGIRNSELVKEKNMNEGLGDPDQLYRRLSTEFDDENGGLNRVPKFPMPSVYQLLFRYSHFSGSEQAREHALKTVDEIISGGIYDQIGGGLARYSTDRIWLVPHFEKMLYDNAQFISLLSDAYAISGNERYRETIDDISSFLERELYNGKGAYYSSLDADSEGEEGKYYTWTFSEIREVAGDDTDFICDYYGITNEGNWEKGKNIPHIATSMEVLAENYEESLSTLKSRLVNIKARLLKARSNRVRPRRDDKTLTAWNALVSKGFADAYQATGDTRYRDQAIRTAKAILSTMADNNYRLYRSTEKKIQGFLDDYAFTCEAFLHIYQISFDESWLHHMRKLIDRIFKEFYDKETAMFYYSCAEEENPVSRQHEFSDNVIPASNSVMAKNLLLASIYFNSMEYQKISRQMLMNIQPHIAKSPSFFANWISLLILFRSDFSEIVISGKQYMERRRELCGKYLPDVLLAGTGDTSKLSLLKGRTGQKETLIYVCRNRTCKVPVKSIEEAIIQLEARLWQGR